MSLLLKMIVDFLADLIGWLIDLIPDINLPAYNFSALANAIGYLDSFVSFSAILVGLGIIFSADLISFFSRLLKFVLNKFFSG